MCQRGLILPFLYASIAFNPQPLRLSLLPLKSKKGACLYFLARGRDGCVVVPWQPVGQACANGSFPAHLSQSKKIASFHVDDVLFSSLQGDKKDV